MRVKALIVLFGLGMILAALVGCSGNDTAQTFSLSGSITNAETGTLQPGSTVELIRNGQVVSTQTSQTGGFTFTDLTPGTFFIRSTSPGSGGVSTLSGPFVISAANVQNVTIDTQASTQLPTGVTVPTNGRATLVAIVTNENGEEVTSTVTVNGLTPQTGNPAVVTDIPVPGPHSVTVQADSSSVSFGNVTFTANTVLVIRTTIPGATQGFTVAGQVFVQDQPTDQLQPVSGATVRLLQNGVAVSGQQETTGTNGGFTFSNVPAGTYTIEAVSNANIARTICGPITVSGNVTGADVIGVTPTLAAQLVTPLAGQAGVIAFTRNASGTAISSTTTIGGQSATGNPAVLDNITPGAGAQTVTVVAGGQTQTLPVVFSTLNEITVICAETTT